MCFMYIGLVAAVVVSFEAFTAACTTAACYVGWGAVSLWARPLVLGSHQPSHYPGAAEASL